MLVANNFEGVVGKVGEIGLRVTLEASVGCRMKSTSLAWGTVLELKVDPRW